MRIRNFALLLILGSFIACVSTGKKETDNEDIVEEQPSEVLEEKDDSARLRPEPVDKTVFSYLITDGEVELDPRLAYNADEAQIFTGLYEGLFSYHPLSLEPVYAVAESYTVSEDKKTWTFNLREEARYVNGDPVEAKDFRNAWLSLLEPEREAPYSSLFDIIEGAYEYRTGRNSDSSKVRILAEDEKTLVVHLNHPASFFPNMLCHYAFSPLHPSLLESEKAFNDGPILSNGPYFYAGREDNKILLEKNIAYWDEKNVAFKTIEICWTEDGKEAAELWDSGHIQWLAANIDIEAMRDRSGIQLNAMFATHYYFIRSKETPWQNRSVRRALSLALPWEEIRADYLLPARTLVFPVPDYPELEGVEKTDLEEAKRLLEEAGYPKGLGLPTIKILITPSRDSQKIADFMQASWQGHLGIPVEIEQIPFNAYYPALGKRDDYTVAFTSWIGDFADPYTFLQMWQAESNLNDAGHNDSEYEELIKKSMLEEGKERWEILGQAEQLLLDYGTVLPIAHSPALNIINTDEIAGWFPNAMDLHPFKYLNWAQTRIRPGVALEGAKGIPFFAKL